MLAQHWTPPHVAQMMVDMVPAGAKVLEPCYGNGAILNLLPPGATGIEIDPQYSSVPMDFFDYPVSNKFDCVIMNPPYIKSAKVVTKKLGGVLSGFSNIYAHFVWKSVDHLNPGGCIVAIVPADMWSATGNVPLVNRLFEEGTVTDVIKFHKSPFLPAVSQDVLVFKWVQGDMSRMATVRVI